MCNILKIENCLLREKDKACKKIEICWRKRVVSNNCLLHVKSIGKIKCVQKNRKLLVD